MLDGSFDQALTRLIPSASYLREIIDLSVEKIYRSKQVVEKEAGGYEVIEKLMEAFSLAAYHHYNNESQPRHSAVLRLLPEGTLYALNEQLSVYDSLQLVIDFISGLTDSHAVRLYKIIKGYHLPV